MDGDGDEDDCDVEDSDDKVGEDDGMVGDEHLVASLPVQNECTDDVLQSHPPAPSVVLKFASKR